MSQAAPRRRYSAETKQALLDVAVTEFAEHGYAATSLDVVVAGAAVTKGALYHHFTGKQALFEAVLARVEEEAATRIRGAAASAEDPWEQASSALRAFLALVREPAYRRVVLQDGPAVLGYERLRDQDHGTGYHLVRDVAERVLRDSAHADPAMVDTFSQILFGALSAAGQQVAGAADPEAATLRVELAVGVVLEGVRLQVDAGLRLADPAGGT